MNATNAACTFIDQTFPTCNTDFLAGSVVRGEVMATSDLDIAVVSSDVKAPRVTISLRQAYRELYSLKHV